MGRPLQNSTPTNLSRAPRFSISMPVLFRAREEREWRGGTIENISRSGVLFRAEHVFLPETRVEMSFALPVSVLGEGAAKVTCRGLIVRTVPPSGRNDFPAVAASILNYRMVRADGPAYAQNLRILT